MRHLNSLSVIRILAALLAIIALFMLLPVLVALLVGEPQVIPAFVIPALATLVLAGVLIALLRPSDHHIGPREGFLLVSLGWVCMSVLGAVPFVISGCIPGPVDAFFETMSGFTTTGASVLTDVEAVPKTVLFWRALTHWLGGMGVIALTVAVLPMLGVGGLQLMRAETPGLDVDKVTPKLTHTAKILWLLYLAFTVLMVILLRLGGMDLLEAIDYSFATMATGGFATRNNSLGAWQSPYIHWVVTVFMFLAGVNFVLYFKLFQGRLRDVWTNTELRLYALIAAGVSLQMALCLWGPVFPDFASSLEHAAFAVVSVLTTTGFMTVDYNLWPAVTHALFLVLMFTGGSAGSTAGGIKVFRVGALMKLGLHEARRELHPRGVFTLRFNGVRIKKEVMYPVAAFVTVYVAIALLSTILVALQGVDLLSAFTAVLACLGNIGPGLGMVGPAANYAFMNDWNTAFLSFLMLLGRLELYTVLVLFMPRFWRR